MWVRLQGYGVFRGSCVADQPCLARQKVAAYWSISWPALIASFAMGAVFETPALITLGANVTFFVIQAVLSRRLVRKKYRTFRVGIVQDDGERGRGVSVTDVCLIWLWILGPQLALFITASQIVWWFSAQIPPETIRFIASLSLWLRFLVVGPYSIDLAMAGKISRVSSTGLRL